MTPEERAARAMGGSWTRNAEERIAAEIREAAAAARTAALDEAGRWLNRNGFGPLAISMLMAIDPISDGGTTGAHDSTAKAP